LRTARLCMSAPHVAEPQEVEAERAAAAKVLLSPSLLALHARSAGLTVPAMRLQLLKVRSGCRLLRRGAASARLRGPTAASVNPKQCLSHAQEASGFGPAKRAASPVVSEAELELS